MSWVDLLTSYSKRSDLGNELATVRYRLEQDLGDSPALSVSSEQRPRLWRVCDRLTEDEIQTLVARYQEGVTSRELASESKIGVTSVKRLLRTRGVRRTDAPA